MDPTCLNQRIRRPKGWMFWACFNGSLKGVHQFWEKDWGSINKDTYCERIVPLIDGYIRWLAQPEQGSLTNLIFMQDNAPGHAAQVTIDELVERGVILENWPAFSPDLNPIETLWNKMKDWLDEHYPEPTQNYDYIRERVNAAWLAVGPETLKFLIQTMQDRCQAVIDAQGGHTIY